MIINFGLSRPASSRPRPPRVGQKLVSARDVTVDLTGKTVLRNASIDIHAGEVLALVGPNGAGKSTLLSTLSGDVQPRSGKISILGKDLGQWSSGDLALRRSVLLQRNELAFPFSVFEVIAMGRAPWSSFSTQEEDDKAITDAIASCELADFVDRPYSSLSGGERARVSLARILAQQTPIMMLDEPTAAFDIRHQEMTLKLCRQYAAKNIAVVVVLHDLSLAAAYCDRVALISHGQIQKVGTVSEVFEPERLSTVYRQSIDVFTRPETGEILILPTR